MLAHIKQRTPDLSDVARRDITVTCISANNVKDIPFIVVPEEYSTLVGMINEITVVRTGMSSPLVPSCSLQ